MEYNEEINESDMSEESQPGATKQWFQDNLRIIISVLIVVLIAGGIYSYSKRTATPTSDQQTQQSNVLSDISGTDQSTESTDQSATVQQGNQQAQQQQQKKDTSSVSTSQETDKSFVETAVRGDSATTLARRALANYLEKNPDSSLTAEHKIYIEDYLRRNAGPKGGLQVGTSVEFSKDSLQNAISKSKTLNDKQLKNLHKYAVRVPSLS